MSCKIFPYYTSSSTARDRFILFFHGWAQLASGLVQVLSLGFLVTDVCAWVLFYVFDED